MGFQFRYESLLNLRKHEKEKAELEYARALGDRMRAEELLRGLEGQYEEERKLFKESLFKETSGHSIRNHGDYLHSLAVKKEEQKRIIEGLQYALEKKRKELLEKEKRVKVLETLRDKDFEKWQKKQDELEQKRINELAVLRHGRVYV